MDMGPVQIDRLTVRQTGAIKSVHIYRSMIKRVHIYRSMIKSVHIYRSTIKSVHIYRSMIKSVHIYRSTIKSVHIYRSTCCLRFTIYWGEGLLSSSHLFSLQQLDTNSVYCSAVQSSAVYCTATHCTELHCTEIYLYSERRVTQAVAIFACKRIFTEFYCKGGA